MSLKTVVSGTYRWREERNGHPVEGEGGDSWIGLDSCRLQ